MVEALIAHHSTRKINFTGSAMVGSIVAKLAGQYLKPLLLELGGKSPQIVLEDADLHKAAQAALVGAWVHVRHPQSFLLAYCVARPDLHVN